MDGERFDRIAVAFGTAPSRRRVLRLLAGSAAGALPLRLGLGEAAAQTTCKPAGKKCSRPGQCCNKICKGPEGRQKCRCKQDGAACRRDENCCDAPSSGCCGPAGGKVCTELGTLINCRSCGDACEGTTPACCGADPPDNLFHCADLHDNLFHCGSCGTDCSRQGFDFGWCCGGGCVDLFTDPNHCGDCDAPACTGTTPACCAGDCEDLAGDPNHCGKCFQRCNTGAVPNSTAVVCTSGRCVATACAAGFTLVAGRCCPNARLCGAGASRACCESGESCCGGACTDTQVDPRNCGGCGVGCPAGVSCAGGSCKQGSFGEPCSANAPCSYTNPCTGDSCLVSCAGSSCERRCCIPRGVSCVAGQVTFSGACCCNPSLSCPSVGTCP